MDTPKAATIECLRIAGGATAVARELGLNSYQVAQQWGRAGKVPVAHCPNLERLVSGAVTVEKLRPDHKWVRVKDKTWPHPAGRPLPDFATEAA